MPPARIMIYKGRQWTAVITGLPLGLYCFIAVSMTCMMTVSHIRHPLRQPYGECQLNTALVV